MNGGAQNIRAAFSRGGTREVPAVIPYEGIFIRDHWDQLVSYPWWYYFEPDIEKQLAWRSEAQEVLGQDWFRLPEHYPEKERRTMRMITKNNTVYLINDKKNTEKKLTRPRVSGWKPGRDLHSRKPEAIARTKEEVARCIPGPDPSGPERMVREGRDALARRMLAEYQGMFFPLVHVGSPLWQCYQLWGFEEMMVMTAKDPELTAYACRRYLDLRIQEVKRAALLGAEGVWIEECLTDLISPQTFTEINMPLIRRLTKEIRDCGMKSIYYYCGDPAGKLEQILSCGADAVSFEESKKGFQIDIEDVVEAVNGRCTVLGNLDAVGLLEKGSERELENEIRRQIYAGKENGGRFIMSLGSPVTPGTPVARVRLYCDMVHRLGKL